MKQSIMIVIVIVVSLPELARAAEPAKAPQAARAEPSAQQPAAANPDAIVPKRTVKFVVSQEEAPLTFQAGVPGLLDQRFVTHLVWTFKLPAWRGGMPSKPFSDRRYPLRQDGKQGVQRSKEDSKLDELLSWGPTRALGRPFEGVELGPPFVDLLMGRLPPEHLPPADVLSDIKKQVEFRPVRRFGGWGIVGESRVFRVTLVAPTAERAEADARAMLTLIDYGLLYAFYQDFREASVYLDALLQESREKTQEQARELSAAETELAGLKELAGFSPESIANLVSQGQMVAVDEAGVKARIDACNRILEKRKDLNPNRVEQVETVKVAAEIELVGLSAKRKALEELLKKVRRHEYLSNRLRGIQTFDWSVKQYVSALEEKRTALQATLEPKTFFGQVASDDKGKEVPGTVFIHKIKWVEPEPMGMPGPAKR